MKKIKCLLLMAVAAMAAVSFTACSDDKDVEERIVSEYSLIDGQVAQNKLATKNNKAVLLVAFGSTWDNAFKAFDNTVAEYKKNFPGYDVYLSFSSDICINRASIGENEDESGNIVKRDYYAPIYWLHALGAAKYDEIRVQSLQVIPGEEFAAVVASVKKFANNGFISTAHLDDQYLANVKVYLGMPLLADPETDVPTVAGYLNEMYGSQAKEGVVAFMGHGNPDSYDTFKANIRYTELEDYLQAHYSKNYYVGTVDMPDNYKGDVLARMKDNGITSGKMQLYPLMSIAGDHSHNDMSGKGDDYWDAADPESEDNSWNEFFSHNGFTVSTTDKGLLEASKILGVWMNHTKNAELLEDAYHSMYPEE